jgi:hypothetical protein
MATTETSTDWTDEEYLMEVILYRCSHEKIVEAVEAGYLISQSQEKPLWVIHSDDYAEWKDHPIVKSLHFVKCGV